MGQSYQEVSRIIKNDITGLKRLGIVNLDKLFLAKKKVSYQEYFYYRKNKHPEKYERLTFDTNSHKPFSRDLSEIIMDFKMCGYLDYFDNILLKI